MANAEGAGAAGTADTAGVPLMALSRQRRAMAIKAGVSVKQLRLLNRWCREEMSYLAFKVMLNEMRRHMMVVDQAKRRHSRDLPA